MAAATASQSGGGGRSKLHRWERAGAGAGAGEEPGSSLLAASRRGCREGVHVWARLPQRVPIVFTAVLYARPPTSHPPPTVPHPLLSHTPSSEPLLPHPTCRVPVDEAALETELGQTLGEVHAAAALHAQRHMLPDGKGVGLQVWAGQRRGEGGCWRVCRPPEQLLVLVLARHPDDEPPEPLHVRCTPCDPTPQPWRPTPRWHLLNLAVALAAPTRGAAGHRVSAGCRASLAGQRGLPTSPVCLCSDGACCLDRGGGPLVTGTMAGTIGHRAGQQADVGAEVRVTSPIQHHPKQPSCHTPCPRACCSSSGSCVHLSATSRPSTSVSRRWRCACRWVGGCCAPAHNSPAH